MAVIYVTVTVHKWGKIVRPVVSWMLVALVRLRLMSGDEALTRYAQFLLRYLWIRIGEKGPWQRVRGELILK